MNPAPSGPATLPAKVPITLEVNGSQLRLAAAPWISLLDLLRDELDLIAPRRAAITGNAAPARSCSTASG